MPGTRRKRSAAWRYFKLVDGKAVCQINHCQTELMWHGSTTALNAHLQSRHSDMMRIHLDQPIMSSETPSISGQQSPNNTALATMVSSHGKVLGMDDSTPGPSISHQEIDQKISDWVAAGPRHACAVEEKTFKDLIQSLVPTYKVPSAMVIAGMINSRYFTAKSNLQRNLLHAAETAKVALSIRVISGPRDRLALSSHFITNVWTLNTEIIGCISGDVLPQTGEGVAKWINDKLQDLNLPPASVAAIVHSNESWVTCGVNMLADAFGWHSLLCCESVLRFVTENLCQDQQIFDVLCKANKMVQFFTASEIGKSLLQLAKERNENENSATIHPPQNQTLQSENNSVSPTSMELIQVLVKVLQPLDAALNYLKKNEFVPSSATPILFSGLKKKLQSEVEVVAVIKEETSSAADITLSSDSLEKRLKKKFLDFMKTLTVFNANDVTTKTAALDPRYKKLFFINADERQALISMISAECFFLHKDEVLEDEEESSEALPKIPRTETSNKTPENSMMDDIMKLGSGCHDDEELQDTSQEVLLNRIKKEMDAYFSEKPPPSDVDPLGWWRVNQSRYPLMSKLAQSYLCIPAIASSSDVELGVNISGICNHIPLCKGDRIILPKAQT